MNSGCFGRLCGAVVALLTVLAGPCVERAGAQSCTFTEHPLPASVCPGGSFSLFVSIQQFGPGTQTYTWYRNNVPIPNSNSQVLTRTNVTVDDAGSYRCNVQRTGGLGVCNSSSNSATVTVNTPVSAVAPNPSPVVCNNGAAFSLSVQATGGSGPITYRWYFNGVPLSDSGRHSGTGTATVTVSPSTAFDGQNPWSCLVTGACGSLMVSVPGPVFTSGVSIASQPVSVMMCPGGTARFNVTAGGVSSYRWFRGQQPVFDGGKFSGATTPNLIVSNVASDVEGTYLCQLIGSCGIVLTSNVTLTAGDPPPPVFTQAPAAETVAIVGRPLSLTARAGGPGIAYRWDYNGLPMVFSAGETGTGGGPGGRFSAAVDAGGTATLTVSEVTAGDSGAEISVRALEPCAHQSFTSTRLLMPTVMETGTNSTTASAMIVPMQNGVRVGGDVVSLTSDTYKLVSPPTGPQVHKRTVRLVSQTEHTMFLIGQGQSSGQMTGEVVAQAAQVLPDGSRRLCYYTCGEGADSSMTLYVLRDGGEAPYVLVLTDEVEPVLPIGGPALRPNAPVSISTSRFFVGFNSDIWAYDARGNAISGFGNDNPASGDTMAAVTRQTGGPGESLMLAVSSANLANNQLSPADDQFRTGAVVLSPNVTFSSFTGPVDPIYVTVVQPGGPSTTTPVYFSEKFQVIWLNVPVSFGGCSGADLGSQGGVNGGDNTLDNNDFIAFINLFFEQHAAADLGVQGGELGSDGAFDNNDFIAFINLFFEGC